MSISVNYAKIMFLHILGRLIALCWLKIFCSLLECEVFVRSKYL